MNPPPPPANPAQPSKPSELPELELYRLPADRRETAAAKAWRVIRRRPIWFAAPLVACLVLAVALAAVRSPTYTANARLGIGRINVTTYSIPGFVGASKDLAVAYSRSIKATGVTVPLARARHTTPGQINAHLSASPIPESPIIVVTATGRSDRSAIQLANAAQSELVAYVKRLNRVNPDSARLLAEYQRSSLERSRIADELARAKAAVPPPGALDDLNAKYAAASLEMKTLSGLYRSSQEGQAATDVLQVISPATSASSDAGAVRQRLLFVGLLAGLVAGVALALLMERRARSTPA
jgi:uncharacterized protein involved in exopolysaccharide biosynthesis